MIDMQTTKYTCPSSMVWPPWYGKWQYKGKVEMTAKGNRCVFMVTPTHIKVPGMHRFPHHVTTPKLCHIIQHMCVCLLKHTIYIPQTCTRDPMHMHTHTHTPVTAAFLESCSCNSCSCKSLTFFFLVQSSA